MNGNGFLKFFFRKTGRGVELPASYRQTEIGDLFYAKNY